MLVCRSCRVSAAPASGKRWASGEMIAILANAETGLSHPVYAAGEIHSVLAVARTSNRAIAVAQLQSRLHESGFERVTIVDAAPASLWRAFRPHSTSVHFWRALLNGLSVGIFDYDDQTGRPGLRR
jgi:hypothetical protein